MSGRDAQGAGVPPGATGGSGGRRGTNAPKKAVAARKQGTMPGGRRTVGRSSKEDPNWQVDKKEVRSRPLEEKELVVARRMFFELDRDGSGSIDAEELGIMLRSLGQSPTEQEINELINSVDGGGSSAADGQIQLREFLVLYAQGLDSKGKAGSTDVNDCFLSMGGNPRAKDSTVAAAHVHDVLMREFDLDVDVEAVFPTKGGELARSDFETLLLGEQ